MRVGLTQPPRKALIAISRLKCSNGPAITGVGRVRSNCPLNYDPCLYFAVCGRRARFGDRQRLQSSHRYLHVFDRVEDHTGMVRDRLLRQRNVSGGTEAHLDRSAIRASV